jgi:acyl-CoA synthetase (NDP forming)
MIDFYRSEGRHEIGEWDAKIIMKAYGFKVPDGDLARSAAHAGDVADKLGYPLVMKVSSPYILHKSDAGGVKVGLKTRKEVEEAYTDMMKTVKERVRRTDIEAVLMEKMMGGKEDKEVIVGMSKDPQFGPMMMFGLGGIFVEVLKDVCFGLAPLTADEALKMIQNTKSYKLLTGARGSKPNDVNAIVDAMQRMSQLVTDFGDIAEIDINPLKVGEDGKGAMLLDARIILTK